MEKLFYRLQSQIKLMKIIPLKINQNMKILQTFHSLSFLKKDLFKKSRDRSQVLRPLMSLSYCSIRDDQNLIEILPRV